jgi:hypothetical protein
MHKNSRSIAFIATLTLAGVASGAKPDKTAIPPVEPGQAQIVFLRHSIVGARENTLIYDTTSGQPKVIGIIPNHRKLVVSLPPGDHVFMIGNLPMCDFLQASVLPDKRYHVVVVARWPEGFTLRPVRHQADGQPAQYLYSSEEFQNMLKLTTRAGRAPESFVKSELENAETHYAPKWQQWQTKTPEQKAVLTLRPEDGGS